jgi:hypothetical protein
VHVGNFMSAEEYRQEKITNREINLWQASALYAWQWDSDVNRTQFRTMRIRSDAIKNDSKFIIAAVVVNHLLSAFNAGKKAAAYNKSLAQTDGWSIQLYAESNPYLKEHVTCSLVAPF